MKTNQRKRLAKFKIPITCWKCERVYDYEIHETCPFCDSHFLDEKIAYGIVGCPISDVKRILFPLLMSSMLFLGACTKHTCATYSGTDFIAPIEEQRLTKWDTVPATYGDLIEYMKQDTTKQKFTWVEKLGVAVGVYLIVGAIRQQTED